MNPEAFLQLDRVIHEKGRLAIMSMLAASPELSFTEMRDSLKMTDGNLTTHIRTLQEAGYVDRFYREATTAALTYSRADNLAASIQMLGPISRRNQPSWPLLLRFSTASSLTSSFS